MVSCLVLLFNPLLKRTNTGTCLRLDIWNLGGIEWDNLEMIGHEIRQILPAFIESRV
ncbi:unnamed protein product [Phyllotreta striolata]|uniref:Uncharacterized protein n=1 Tax=Phyllotreta striolata TaxID=444603 RepID=A0A9N9TLK7_PHYSR|nr:unnamed protein product [Phyllotreta striolata]